MPRTAPDLVRRTPSGPAALSTVKATRPPLRRRRNPIGALSVVVALVALVLGLVPLVGLVSWPLAIVAAVLGIVGATRSRRPHAPSIAGIAMSAAALVVGFCVSVSSLGSVAAALAADAAAPTSAVAPPVVALPSAAPRSTARVVDETPVGTPSVRWILTDPGGQRYGGYPRVQRQVIAAIAAADVAYRRATTADARAGILAGRDAAVCRMLPGGVFTDWVGSVHASGTTSAGTGWISVHVATTMVMQTWDNPLSDTGLHTLVSRSSPVYRALTAATPGSLVRFSGRLLPSSTSCLQRQNATQDMYGLDPNFIVRVTALSAR